MADRARPRVVVVGAGFGGLWAARALRGEPVDVLILDRDNYHTFLPLLYQVAAAELGPTEIAYPVRSIFRGAANVRFRMAEVVDVDLERRRVRTAVEEIPYDHLILAPGSTPDFFGVDGAEEHAFPLRTMRQAIPLRHHILSRFEAAVYERDAVRRRSLLTFLIVGGGPTGVEYAGALAELVYGPLRNDYPDLDPSDVRIVLVEALERLLPAMPDELGEFARDRLRRRGVDVRTGTMVERVAPDCVELADGSRVASDTVVWTAGVQGDPAAERWGLPVGKGGRVRVEETLQLPGHPEVQVAGDLAYAEDDGGRPVPQVAPAAIQEGEHAAANVLRTAHGRPARPFRYDDPGMLAVIGRNAGVAQVRGRTFTGFLAWLLWLIVHIAKLIGFRNRMLVLVNWAWNYFSYERAVRLILPLAPESGFERAVADPSGDDEPAERRDAPGRSPISEG